MHSLRQLQAGTAALLCLFPASSSSAQLTPYTDPTTDITLHAYSPTRDYQLGFVLPENVTTDFIAQIVAPLKDGQGWAGVAFGRSMLSTLLIVTWYCFLFAPFFLLFTTSLITSTQAKQ